MAETTHKMWMLEKTPSHFCHSSVPKCSELARNSNPVKVHHETSMKPGGNPAEFPEKLMFRVSNATHFRMGRHSIFRVWQPPGKYGVI